MDADIVVNRFESYEFQGIREWVAIHDEELNFSDNSKPQIKLCGITLRIRANNEWTKLPKNLKAAMVAHEIGHREMGHASIPQDNPFYRMGFVLLQNGADPRELEADRYAAKIIGRTEFRDALNTIAKLSYITPLAAKELNLRAKKL